jgi:hypothetical protein
VAERPAHIAVVALVAAVVDNIAVDTALVFQQAWALCCEQPY